MMRFFSLVFILLVCFQSGKARGGDQVVTLGDSLTFAYETSFGSAVTIPFVGTYGDGFGSGVKNWVEILNDPLYRKGHFDLGARRSYSVNLGFTSLNQFFRHSSNWAVPGMKINELKRFMNREVTLLSLLEPELAALLASSNFDESTDFAIGDLEGQIRGTAKRLTLFIGGNDVRGVYGNIYNQNAPGSFVQNFVNDATVIVDRVLQLNPNLQVVLVNVPHVGITPEVKGLFPPDAIKTGRVTAVLRDLNAQLRSLAASRNIGYADVFELTLPLLGASPMGIHGIAFSNSGSTTGNLNFIWLNGSLSRNFHPNTNAQAIIANRIIAAFNERYQTGIAPLTATEILGGLLGRSATQIDMTLASWMTGFGKTGLPVTDDSDGDGVTAGVEFALGMNPSFADGETLSLRRRGGNLELGYPLRLPASARFSLVPEFSSNLVQFSAFPTPPVPGADGLARASLPLGMGRGFMRLRAVVP